MHLSRVWRVTARFHLKNNISLRCCVFFTSRKIQYALHIVEPMVRYYCFLAIGVDPSLVLLPTNGSDHLYPILSVSEHNCNI